MMDITEHILVELIRLADRYKKSLEFEHGRAAIRIGDISYNYSAMTIGEGLLTSLAFFGEKLMEHYGR